MVICKIMRDTAVCVHSFDMMSGSIKAYYILEKEKVVVGAAYVTT